MVFVIIQALQNSVILSSCSSYILLRLLGGCSLDILYSVFVSKVCNI